MTRVGAMIPAWHKAHKDDDGGEKLKAKFRDLAHSIRVELLSMSGASAKDAYWLVHQRGEDCIKTMAEDPFTPGNFMFCVA